MYCVYGNISWYIHGGPLFGKGPLLGESVIGGSIVLHGDVSMPNIFYSAAFKRKPQELEFSVRRLVITDKNIKRRTALR